MSSTDQQPRSARWLGVALGVVLAGASVSVAAARSPGSAASAPGTAGTQAAPERPQIFMGLVGAGRGAGHKPGGGGSSNLYYHGGVPGVETGRDLVYLVYWGSQWTNNDPSGEAALQQAFFTGVGGSSWNNSVTQYCQSATTDLTGTYFCNGNGTPAVNPSGSLLGDFWYDNTSAAPAHPKQSQLAAEAARAATHFIGTGTLSSSQISQVQFVINTATGNNSSGFGTRFCAWHSSTTSSTYGTIAYTNMPYITDAGASCGANFNGLGPNAGITIVGGHEFAETETDIFPNGGWLDANGAENGDKCAWISSGQGAAADITLTIGTKQESFAVQSLWSNAFNNDKGGCVLSY